MAQAPVTNLNAALTVGGRISGAVRNAGGTGIPSVSVTAYRLVGGQWQTVGSGFTDNAGAYTVDGLRTGTYRVRFQTFGAGGYLPEYYQDKDTLETANDVAVSQGATATANAVLDVGGQISGTVTGPSGAGRRCHRRPLRPEPVLVLGLDLEGLRDHRGGRCLLVRRPGPRRLPRVRRLGHRPGARVLERQARGVPADTITAAKNSTATASFALVAARKITGTVTSRAGGALSSPSVQVYRKLTGPDGSLLGVRSVRDPWCGRGLLRGRRAGHLPRVRLGERAPVRATTASRPPRPDPRGSSSRPARTKRARTSPSTATAGSAAP